MATTATAVKPHIVNRPARGGKEYQAQIMLDGVMHFSPWYGKRGAAAEWANSKVEQSNAKDNA